MKRVGREPWTESLQVIGSRPVSRQTRPSSRGSSHFRRGTLSRRHHELNRGGFHDERRSRRRSARGIARTKSASRVFAAAIDPQVRSGAVGASSVREPCSSCLTVPHRQPSDACVRLDFLSQPTARIAKAEAISLTVTFNGDWTRTTPHIHGLDGDRAVRGRAAARRARVRGLQSPE